MLFFCFCVEFEQHNAFKEGFIRKIMEVYLQLLEKIANASKLSKEEVERKVEAKRAKLSGLVSKEGAAQIVAAELGINFEKEKVKLNELVQGMKRANVLGKIIEAGPVRTFRKNEREGKVANITIADETSMVKAVLWDTNHISLIEQGRINKGDVIEISNGMVRNGELHLSSFSDIKKTEAVLSEVVQQRKIENVKLKDIKPGIKIKTKAFIVQVFDPRYFEVCEECGKKVLDEECILHGKVKPRRRALLSLVLDDGSETIRAVLFGEQILSLGLKEDEIFSLEMFSGKKENILGEELLFTGNLKSNQLYNTIELMVEGIEQINPENLLKEMQNAS